MLFNVAGLLKQPVGATRSYRLDDDAIIGGGEDDRFESIAGRVRMLRTDQGILVEAEIGGDTAAPCSRCLAPANLTVSAAIEEEFYPTNPFDGFSTAAYGEPESADEGDRFYIDDRNMLNLSETARQALSSALPMAPLCRPDCKGICPYCAADRNVEPCDCRAPVGQWQKLIELKR